MSNNNGIITAPIDTTDVSKVLGVASDDVGTLCISDRINKWSMYKPVRYDSVSVLEDTQLASVNYGFDIAAASDGTLLGLFKKASVNQTWIYLFPRGGNNNEYFRLTDFMSYKSDAEIPFDYSDIPSLIPIQSESIGYVFKFKASKNANIDMDKLSHFHRYPQNNSYRYAVAYRRSGDSKTSFAIGPQIAGMAGRDITIQVPLSLGTYECLFMVTTLNDPEPIYVDSTFMPNGLFEVTVHKLFRTASITIKSGFSNIRMDSYSIYGLSQLQLSIQSETSDAVPPVYGRLDLLIYMYYSNNIATDSFYVTGSINGSFSYSGVSVQTYNLDYLNGNEIIFSEYGIDGGGILRCEVIPQIIITSGDGLLKFSSSYNFKANR